MKTAKCIFCGAENQLFYEPYLRDEGITLNVATCEWCALEVVPRMIATALASNTKAVAIAKFKQIEAIFKWKLPLQQREYREWKHPATKED
jgi:hypothetical protein